MTISFFDWSEYLNLATQLSRNSDEASQRSSISRAYYCVYHKASEHAVVSGYVDQRSHAKLWDVYGRSADNSCRKLHDLGSRMKKERVAADYDPAAARLPERMAVQLDRANAFLTRLAGLPLTFPGPKPEPFMA